MKGDNMKAWTATIALSLLALIPFTGCKTLRDWDTAIWAPVTLAAPSSQPATAGTPAAAVQQAWPILETIAGILAALGFGGMYRSMSKARTSNGNQLTALAESHEERTAALDNKLAEVLRLLTNKAPS